MPVAHILVEVSHLCEHVIEKVTVLCLQQLSQVKARKLHLYVFKRLSCQDPGHFQLR